MHPNPSEGLSASRSGSWSGSRTSLRRLSVGASLDEKPSWWVRYFKLGDTKQLKILHDDVNEKAIFNVVRRNSLKKDGLSEEEIQKMIKTEEKAHDKWLIHPESRYRLWWDMLTALSVLYLIWLVPIFVGERDERTSETAERFILTPPPPPPPPTPPPSHTQASPSSKQVQASPASIFSWTFGSFLMSS